MPITHQLSTPHKQPGSKLSQPKGAAASLTDKWQGTEAAMVAIIPVIDSAHPDWPLLLFSDFDLEWMEGDVVELTLIYKGVFGPGGGDPPPLAPPKWELQRATSQDPIATHVDFATELGGTKDAPLNGAKFDKDGVFKGFKVQDGGDSGLSGVTSYLAPSAHFKYHYTAYSEPTEITVPQIYTGGLSGVPTLASPRNWLIVEQSWSRQGSVYEITYGLLASGYRGWNTLIYP